MIPGEEHRFCPTCKVYNIEGAKKCAICGKEIGTGINNSHADKIDIKEDRKCKITELKIDEGVKLKSRS